MANKINTFFATVGDKLAQKIVVKNNIKPVLQIININVQNTIFIKSTDVRVIISSTNTLKPRSSAGIDTITVKTIKQ